MLVQSRPRDAHVPAVVCVCVRLGFRTERIRPFSIKEGVTIRRRLPLDGNEGHAKLEVRANLCLPEPEVRHTRDLMRLADFTHSHFEISQYMSSGRGVSATRLAEVISLCCCGARQIEYSTDKKRLIAGCGDIQLTIQELNLCLEY
jgi:hypothetical protein